MNDAIKPYIQFVDDLYKQDTPGMDMNEEKVAVDKEEQVLTEREDNVLDPNRKAPKDFLTAVETLDQEKFAAHHPLIVPVNHLNSDIYFIGKYRVRVRLQGNQELAH